MSKIKCLIMAGGAGTRFWPRSRNATPKQYLSIFGGDSLLQSTIKRFNQFVDYEDVCVVSAKDQQQILEQQADKLPKNNFIYEPVGKNTLPAIGLAAIFIEKDDPNAVMVVSPADHLIKNEELFATTVETAAQLAKEQKGIVTIGITPQYPATGYGYVQTQKEINKGGKIKQFKVAQFVEKPAYEKAKEYIQNGSYYWNSGLFVFQVKTFLEAVEKFTPDLYKGLKELQSYIGTSEYNQNLTKIYHQFEKISVDYGIMEHADNIYLVEGNFEWNDLGSWESVYQESLKDENKNVASKETILVDSKNSYVYTDEGIVALVGLNDVVVVREGNMLLVCQKDKTEDIKKVVEQLKEQGKKEYL